MSEGLVIIGLALLLAWLARLILFSGRATPAATGKPVQRPFWRMMLLRAILIAACVLLIAFVPDSGGGSRGGKNGYAPPVGLSVAAWVAIAVIVIDALWDCLKPDGKPRFSIPRRADRMKRH